MAKRHHHSMKEAKGYKAAKTHDGSFKRMDHGIEFHEDMSAPSLLPREVIYKYWPKSPYNNMGMVDDLFDEVQKQMTHDNSQFGKLMNPEEVVGDAMPQSPRPNEKLMKIAYKILNTPKEQQQDNQRVPSPKRIKEWFRDSLLCQ